MFLCSSANLVQTKEEAIKTLQEKLAEAKRTIVELRAEVQTLRQCTADELQWQQQQQQQKDATHASIHSLATIHTRYQRVLQVLEDNNCSMVNAFRLPGCLSSTLRGCVAIVVIGIVDECKYNLALRDMDRGSIKELEAVCRRLW